jgi:hypothetical protein
VNARERAYVFARLALLIKHATRIRHIVRGLPGSTMYFDYISNGTIKKKVAQHKIVCFDFPHNLF